MSHHWVTQVDVQFEGRQIVGYQTLWIYDPGETTEINLLWQLCREGWVVCEESVYGQLDELYTLESWQLPSDEEAKKIGEIAWEKYVNKGKNDPVQA